MISSAISAASLLKAPSFDERESIVECGGVSIFSFLLTANFKHYILYDF